MKYKSHSKSYKEEIQEANPVRIDYLVRNEEIKNDFTRLIPAKTIEWVRVPWGAPYGYTYIGHNKAWLDERLKEKPEFKEEVDVHECDHCPVELRTRYIAWERVKKEPREERRNKLIKADFYNQEEYHDAA